MSESNGRPYEIVIGLEVHCQLKTATKLFCSCGTDSFGAVANTRVCPVCTAHPGVLPVLNGRAVELAFRAALAVGCRLRESSIFARKNYFYPDLPKAYQISQYEQPFAEAGFLEIAGPPVKRVGIHRIHMEEDAGKLLHAIGAEELDYSLADFNRAGVPLVEIVSEPDLRASEEAYQYLTALKAVLQYVDASNCDMEKGEMRCDANVSVRPYGQKEFGTRTEIKNLNSFRNVKDAIEHEAARQWSVLQDGGKIVQETRLWDAERGETRPMRSKEEAHDYRYFPEPDLAPLRVDAKTVDVWRHGLPELPQAKRRRLVDSYRLSESQAAVISAERSLADYYEKAVDAAGGSAQGEPVANFFANEFLGKLNASGKALEDSPVGPERLGALVQLIAKGTLSNKLAKDVFGKMWETGKSAEELTASLGMAQVSDEKQIAEWVAAAMQENPKAVEDMKAGKERAIGAIVGSVMKKSKGKANPDLVNRLIRERL